MKKEHVQIAIIAGGLILMAFFIMANLKKSPKKPAVETVAASGDQTTPTQTAAASAKKNDKIALIQSKRWELAWSRDPFLAVSENVGKMNEFQLKGISFSGNKKGYAFINDQIIAAGDAIGDYQVALIEKDKVTLKRGAQTFFLTFTEQQ